MFPAQKVLKQFIEQMFLTNVSVHELFTTIIQF